MSSVEIYHCCSCYIYRQDIGYFLRETYEYSAFLSDSSKLRNLRPVGRFRAGQKQILAKAKTQQKPARIVGPWIPFRQILWEIIFGFCG